MDWFLVTIIFVLIVILAVVVFAAYRFYRKAVIYDEIITFIYEDVETNIMQFGKMSKTNVMMADNEIQTAHRNMMIMGRRLEEILIRMESATGLRLRPPERPPRPKVVN